MTTFTDFIEREIEPTLGDYADSYNTEAIAEEVADFDPREGYVWKPEYETDEAYWKIVAKHTIH